MRSPAIDAGFRRTGMLFLHPPEDVDDVRSSAERLNELGIETALVRSGSVREGVPDVRP